MQTSPLHLRNNKEVKHKHRPSLFFNIKNIILIKELMRTDGLPNDDFEKWFW